MKNLSQPQLKTLTFLSLICWFIPFSIYSLWIYAFSLGTTQTDRVSIFKDYFPDFLNGRWSLTLLSIAFCILAIILSALSKKVLSKSWKLLNSIILILSILLLALNVFSII